MLQRSAEHYVYRMGSDNQIHIHWTGNAWRYEFLAGGVLFDEQLFSSEEELSLALEQHGLALQNFTVDQSGETERYSQAIREKIKKLEEMGIEPCAKHGLSAKNLDGTCEACLKTDYPDDFKGTEG